MRAMWSEWDNVFSVSSDQVRIAKRSYRDMPLLVLSNGTPRLKNSNETQELADAKRQLWLHLHEDIARLSSRGIHRIVPNSHHYIQLDRADAVIDAIREVLRATTGAH
jgi:hypothetical protein